MADERGQRWEQGTPTPPIVAHASPEVPSPYGDEIERLRAEVDRVRAEVDDEIVWLRSQVDRMRRQMDDALLEAAKARVALAAARNP